MADTIASHGDALFHREGEKFVPTLYTQGPHDPAAQFGGSPAALLATLVEQTPTLAAMQIARFTLDLLRPVPLTPLKPEIRVVREGKRIQVVEASLFAGSTEVARSSTLRVRKGDLGSTRITDTEEEPNPLPERPCPSDNDPFPRQAPGSRRAVEYLFEGVGGYYQGPTWARLRVAIIDSQPVYPIARLAYTADFASGIGSRTLALRGINADLALNVVRYPEGEWLCLDGWGWTSREGIGQVQATISDTLGVTSAVSMTRLVDPK
jgi:hypothetical protein